MKPSLTFSKAVTECRRLVDEARSRFESEIEQIAEQVRREHVEPLCREFGCEYMAGNGTYAFFFDNGRTIGFAWTEDEMMRDVPKKMQKRLRDMLDMLDVDTDSNGCIGFYVRDVRKAPGASEREKA